MAMFTWNEEEKERQSLRLYEREGEELSYQETVKYLAGAHAVLFGELHDNRVVHSLQYEITRDLFEIKKRDLILGAEMFETDNQLILDEYLAGLILHRHLVAEAKVWNNYETDYRVLVDFAKEHGLNFIATNIPRRYANLVAREGLSALDSLTDEARRYFAPLPIPVDLETPGYREMMSMNLDMGHGMQITPEHFVAAQAVKDATMAYFIVKNSVAESLFLHFNGVYHSQKYGGIYWYLKQTDPRLALLTVSAVEAEHLEFQKEYKGLGDVIVVVQQHEGEQDAH